MVHRAAIAPRLFASSLVDSDDIVIWEGLPRPDAEHELFVQERTTKPVRELYGYYFYDSPIRLSPNGNRSLRAVLALAANYHAMYPVVSWKKCLEYHPDFAVEVRSGGSSSYALICFTCGEVELHGAWLGSSYDLSDGRALETLLFAERANRPPSAFTDPASPGQPAVPQPSRSAP